ncbi:reprolysin-like metallopeptidase [Actinoplanes sp. L3-i22]|uniref:reprolysin-like metallopeptidase n=1 Tax=Actinoplanes sp. L3-i22 TaxID=2836373 RepID=UPI001C76D01B|nr:hypothetical protein [Actinoplanes sp. L3-i22]BCY11820.1 hypothetical protein L3i22_069080 [Actinoplanes sp. L3-i22]
MRRLLALAVSLIVLPTATVLTLSNPALAFNYGVCKFASGSIKWKDATRTAGYSTAAQNAINAWDSAANSLLTFTKVTSGADLVVADGNFGRGFGYESIALGPNQTNLVSNCGVDGTWINPIYAWVNTYMADAYSVPKRQSAFAHEIGHALGLDDSSAQSCPNIPIMQPSTYPRFDVCGYTGPRPDDIDGIEVLY